MILLIDIGNSRLKWRVLREQQLGEGGIFEHNGAIERLNMDSAWAGLERPTAIIAVNVAAPTLSVTVSEWLQRRWAITARFVSATSQLCGVINGYRIPEQLGADRWVAMVGAAHLYSGACCVVDCGTAVTIDLLDQAHYHLGGLILPGLSLMPRCVIAGTALVDVTVKESSNWGRDTASCLAAGALHAISSTMRQAADDLQSRLGAPVTRLITGGDARLLLPLLGDEWVYEADLVFIGLSHIARHYGEVD